ncbi:MAG: PEP-CTERM sorting domain-containing protein [Planctomycetaceae bacterium]|nr:PEP-CTERM sorting domain-containing protein [Planctomycetaceae bacterium]
MKIKLFVILALSISAIAVQSGKAEQYTPDMDNEAGWTIVGSPDTAHQFGFDYSKYGIPAPPNGGGTTGLWMAANISEGAVASISASPKDISMVGDYDVQFDFYLNFNSSGGTTEFGGGFVGFNPNAGEAFSGGGLLGDSDGDSSRDYRLYRDTNELSMDSGAYAISSQDNSLDPALQAKFPGQTTPEAQNDPNVFNPTNTIVTAPNGTLGYAWHTMEINVRNIPCGGLGCPQTAKFSIDDFEIGTIESSAGLLSNLDGQVAVTFADLFTSVSTKPEFSFGIYDNLKITQVPEPSSALLSLVGLLGLLGLRKKH